MVSRVLDLVLVCVIFTLAVKAGLGFWWALAVLVGVLVCSSVSMVINRAELIKSLKHFDELDE